MSSILWFVNVLKIPKRDTEKQHESYKRLKSLLQNMLNGMDHYNLEQPVVAMSHTLHDTMLASVLTDSTLLVLDLKLKNKQARTLVCKNLKPMQPIQMNILQRIATRQV